MVPIARFSLRTPAPFPTVVQQQTPCLTKQLVLEYTKEALPKGLIMTDDEPHIQNSSTGTTPPVTVSRPYRSHKVPACARCRSRKARCTIDFPGQPCLLCRLQNGICERAEKGQGQTKSPEGPKPKRSRVYQNSNSVSNSPSSRRSKGKNARSVTNISAVATASTSGDAPDKGSTMIVGPTAAEDVQAIEQYVSSKSSENIGRSSRPYNIISNDTSKPVLYLSVPRYRKGLKGNISPGKFQREIMEQILGPFAPTLISMYVYSTPHSRQL